MNVRLVDGPPISPIHVIWGFFAAGVIAIAGLLKAYLPSLPACTFKQATGIPCLTCGSTRSIAALADFNFVRSFLFNPLASLSFIALMLFSFSVGVGILLRRRLEIKVNPAESRAIRIAIAAAVAMNWVYLIIYLK